jgi:hypothetical protein
MLRTLTAIYAVNVRRAKPPGATQRTLTLKYNANVRRVAENARATLYCCS